ncbi:MAG: glycosyltransferase family 39 protein [Parcubacteria group bacterium]|nr:glycosyltransferase family 39 protein [Parcubacteria group bacterium]
MEKKIIGLLVLGIFLVAYAYSLYFYIAPAVDARAYDNIAWNLVQGNGYKEQADLSYDEDLAILRVGPGYEFFLAGVYYLFGHHYQVVWIINALLSAFSAFFIFLISKQIFKEHWSLPIGLVAAGLIGFSPDLITINGMLMTETLGIFFIILSVYIFFRYIERNANASIWLLMLLAVVFGFAVLVRTPALFLIFPLAGYFIWQKFWKELGVFLIVLTLVFTPWTVRNYRMYHTFIPTNLAFGYDLLAGNHPGASGELEPYEGNEIFMKEGRIEGNKLALKESLGFIFSRPIEFLEITFKRISIYFSFARPTGFWFHLEGMSKALTLTLSAVYSAILFIFGFWGIYRMKELSADEKERAKMLLWMLVMMPIAIIGIIVETRYRFLVYPFFAIFASYGLFDLWRGRRELKVLALVTLLLFSNTLFDALRNLDRIRERIGHLFS